MNYNAYPWGRWIKWGVIGLIILIVVLSSISSYNGLVKAEQNVNKSWSQVESVMQRRLDTITNLVEVVKGYAELEKDIFGDIAEARSALTSGAGGLASVDDANEKLTQTAKSIFVLVENYPDLKASEQFQNLQEAIEGSENRVSVERGRFIETVEDYNIRVKRFPGNIFARMMGFKEKDYYKADPEAGKSPDIKF